MPRLADAVADLHEVAEASFDQGGRRGMAAVLRGLRAGMRVHGRGVFEHVAVEPLWAACLRALALRGSLLDARRAAGLVRRGHGDLHLRNICLLGGQPVLFDCIEFNQAIACVDVMYDLAFLLMDLLHRNLAGHANAVLNGYVARTGDVGGLALLPIFLALRAAIRALTQATAAPLHRGAAEAAALRGDARRYLALAQELVAPPAPRLVAVGGPSGSGKTTLARRLAASVGPAPRRAHRPERRRTQASARRAGGQASGPGWLHGGRDPRRVPYPRRAGRRRAPERSRRRRRRGLPRSRRSRCPAGGRPRQPRAVQRLLARRATRRPARPHRSACRRRIGRHGGGSRSSD